VAELDPQQPLARIEVFEQRLNDSVGRPRLAAALLALFAVLGLLLAATGLHSVMFVLVQSRFREIGVRLALGGRPRDIIVMILRSSLRVMLAGLLAGVCLAIWLTQFLQSMWYGVSPTDPFTLAGSAAVLVFAGLAAVSQPAWQASRVDPMDVLRNE
jgi:putative ABC transport system permease protein